MSAPKRQDNALWIAIAAALVLAGLILFGLTRIRLPEVAGPAPAKPSNSGSTIITRIDADSNLSGSVALFDTKILFLPTALNNSDPALPSSFRREPDRALRPLPPHYTYREYEMGVALPEAVEVPAEPVQAVRVGDMPNPYFAFGRINFPYTPLSPRLAMLEVVQARTGRLVLSAPLQARAAQKLPPVDWQPLEMLVAVEAGGMVGEPTVTSGSGFAEVDRYFRELLLQHFRIGARLPPGFYTLRIGP